MKLLPSLSKIAVRVSFGFSCHIKIAKITQTGETGFYSGVLLSKVTLKGEGDQAEILTTRESIQKQMFPIHLEVVSSVRTSRTKESSAFAHAHKPKLGVFQATPPPLFKVPRLSSTY